MAARLTFDEYCAEHGIEPDEYGPAFAAYLHEISGWDGDAERVDE